MTRQQVNSSSIKSVGYDPDAEILEVEIHNSGVYQYFGVPDKVFDDLINASSKGRYFNVYIKNEYSYKRIK